jgi:hypothetical protein
LTKKVGIATTGRGEIRFHLVKQLVHQLGRCQIGDDDATVLTQDARDLFGRSVLTQGARLLGHSANGI